MFALRLAAGALFLIPAALASTAIGQNSSPIALRIDLTDAPRHLVHVAETLPAHAGENSFSYPEWIPGRHRPSGPIDNLTGIVFHAEAANGPVIPWRRDLIDLYSFHVQAPARDKIDYGYVRRAGRTEPSKRLPNETYKFTYGDAGAELCSALTHRQGSAGGSGGSSDPSARRLEFGNSAANRRSDGSGAPRSGHDLRHGLNGATCGFANPFRRSLQAVPAGR